MALVGLARHLDTGHAVDPAEGMAWMASDEGKQFVTMSSQRWAEASVAAGDDAAAAQAASDRTIAAYTAAPADHSGA
jgi:hypothetical protein